MQDWKMQDQTCTVGKYRTGKCGTNLTSFIEVKENANMCYASLYYIYLLQNSSPSLSSLQIPPLRCCSLNSSPAISSPANSAIGQVPLGPVLVTSS